MELLMEILLIMNTMIQVFLIAFLINFVAMKPANVPRENGEPYAGKHFNFSL